jgi:penicillin V acylase-like amidase (Ntn superfamily)
VSQGQRILRSFKDFNLKEAWNRNQKRDHGTAYNSYGEKLQVKNSGYGKRAQTDMERVVAKLRIVNTVLSNGAAVADVNMDFNRKTFEILQARKINQK